MASRKITDLHPLLAVKALQLQQNLAAKEIDLLIYCTWRSDLEQTQLYNVGRKTVGKIVTWAKAGESNHNYTINGEPASLAFDCVPLLSGKPYWTLDIVGFKLWVAISQEAKKLGLEWAGDWQSHKKEMPHFQLNKETIKNVKDNQTQN